ncbi:hypothetical protein [uncultured Amnibacterium sp.]|uniref:hypothetical protein n=1 Tax=uncultured Amnibacterium sp. TaxID=1631851 RepID=UPI0035CBE6EA
MKVVSRGSKEADSLFAVVLPGSGYPALGPALHWPARLLAAAGWRLAVVSWSPETEGGADPVAFVEGALQQAAGDDVPDLLLTKSLGSLAAPWALEHDVPGVWLTPLLTDEAVLGALQRMDDRSIAVGGTADRYWREGAFEGTDIAVLEVPGADHSLELPDWRASLTAQAEVFERLAAHLGE